MIRYHTHVCGILAGDGKLSDGKYRGVAPDSRLVCGKVLDRKGNGSLKNLLMGMQWIIEQKEKYPIRILNISIEIDVNNNIDKKELHLLHKYMELIWNKGILIVVAAGNKGPKQMTLSPIGDGNYCVCVGCNDENYIGVDGKNCSDYSGRGPGKTVDFYDSIDRVDINNPLKKPDIVAPGTDIISCSHNYSSKNRRKDVISNAYSMKSGTSMSAPIVSGACALCLQKYPYLTNNGLHKLLILSARDLGECWNIQGAGMLNVSKMFELADLEMFR